MKQIKGIRTLTLVLLSALFAMALPARQARAAEAILLGSSQGYVGEVITIAGSGFSVPTGASRGVNILFSRNYPASAAVNYDTDVYEKVQVWPLNIDGTFSTTFAVPSTLTGGLLDEVVTPGTHYVYVTYYYPATQATPAINGIQIVAIATLTVLATEITIEPDSGTVGTEVKISGTGFGQNEGITISYDGSVMEVTGDTDTDASRAFGVASLVIPPGTAGRHIITVFGNNSGVAAEAQFLIRPKITVDPASAPAGSVINVRGSGFGNTVAVDITFGNQAVTQVVTGSDGGFIISFAALPRAAGSYDIKAADGAGNSDMVSFTITPTVVSFSQTGGTVGAEVSVSGSGFLTRRPVTVTFADTTVATATSDANGSFSARFTIPSVTLGTHKVRVSDGANINESDFAVLLVAEISPKTSAASPGYVGAELTITGGGFTPGSALSVSYDGNLVKTAVVAADGTFSVTFNVPASSAGTHAVIATDGTNTKQFTFVMESTAPPVPPPLKPEMDLRTGSLVFFDWQDIEDPSGVTYTLQIATSQDFSLAVLVLEKTGLTRSEYTLTKEQKLKSVSPKTPYYWRVRAVDGAGNQSDWTGVGAFSVGFVLSTPVLSAFVAIGILLLVLLAFWLGRTLAYRW